MLHAFITINRDRIIDRCTAKVAARSGPAPVLSQTDHGVPAFLDQLIEELRPGGAPMSGIGGTAMLHGYDQLRQGLTVSQVVHGYGDICQAITELAVETDAPISADEFRTLNRCLDDAIAGAVTEYARARDESSQEGAPVENLRVAKVARDLLKSITISRVALAAIRSGSVGIAGSTGTMLSLAVDTAHDLAELLLVEVGSSGPALPVQTDQEQVR
jgi:hypothetical protein